jgi:hypothetical protein
MVGTGTIPGVIGQGKSFIGHHQVILVTEDHMVNRVVRDMEGLRVNRVVRDMEGLRVNRVDLTGNQVGQDLVGLRASQVEADPMENQAEGDPTLKCMDHRAKLVDLDLSLKWLEDLAEVGLTGNQVGQEPEGLWVNS